MAENARRNAFAARDTARERRLVRAARQGDRGARRRLVAEHLGLVRATARRYRGLGLPDDDLVQEGSLGLLDAIDHYDLSRDVPFEVFARFRVRRAIRNALSEQSRLVRLPKHIVERQRAIARAADALTAASGHPASVGELADATGLSVPAVEAVRDATVTATSLAGSVSADGSPLEGAIPDRTAPDPELAVLSREQAELVSAALTALPARQRAVVTRHYGLDRPPASLAEIAASMQISGRRASTIEHDALEALRRTLPAELAELA